VSAFPALQRPSPDAVTVWIYLAGDGSASVKGWDGSAREGRFVSDRGPTTEDRNYLLKVNAIPRYKDLYCS
jgi:hypothetical protein